MILNKDRTRMITHQWRYLVLFSGPDRRRKPSADFKPRGQNRRATGVANNDEQILIAMVRQVAEGIPRQIYLGGPSPNPYLELKDFIRRTGEPMGRKFDGFVRQNLTVTRVDGR